MDFVLSFFEGIITFISPCLLPMLPIYISYFAGDMGGRKRTFINALGFVLGFTVIFVLLGAFAGTLGRLLIRYSQLVNVVTGAIVVFLGLSFMGVFRFTLFDKFRKIDYTPKSPGFFSSLIFGIVFSIGWTPCVGAFLGSALMLAASSRDSLKGIFMLLAYSLGLGIPFVFSALILDRLKRVFDFIKKNYSIINVISGSLLVLVGILMMTGILGSLLALLSFQG